MIEHEITFKKDIEPKDENLIHILKFTILTLNKEIPSLARVKVITPTRFFFVDIEPDSRK